MCHNVAFQMTNMPCHNRLVKRALERTLRQVQLTSSITDFKPEPEGWVVGFYGDSEQLDSSMTIPYR